ncbi:MAG: tol-pal system protein YbgF [Terriglobia bacterium]
MRNVLVSAGILLAALAWLGPAPAAAVDKEIIQLQRDVALLQQQVRELQSSHEQNMATLRTLLEQALDSVNRMGARVEELESSVQKARANTASDVDSLRTQVQSLRDAVDEVSARLGRMSQQLSETQSVLRSVDARLTPIGAPGTPPPGTPSNTSGGEETPPGPPVSPPPPSAQTLFDNALRDFTTGRYDLAQQQFEDYLNYYGRSELAGSAQFYLGEIRYQQGDFRGAITEYEKVMADYPASFKLPTAHLKKGYALLELGEREAGIEALQRLIEKYPRSEEARLAQERLRRLGETVSP